MSQEYHVIQGSNISGPYDLVTIVKKIRNGTITGDTLVHRNDIQDPQPARNWEELKEFLVDNQGSAKEYVGNAKRLHLMELLKNGLNFLQHNPMSAIYSTIVVIIVAILAWLVNTSLPEEIRTFCEIPLIIFLYFLLSCYLMLVSRMTRGQPADIEQLFTKINKAERAWARLLHVSLLVSFPVIIGILLFVYFDELLISLLGLFIIIVPGIYTITVYSFAPLLIVEQGYGTWKAMETSRSAILKGGADNFSVYFSLNAINFIAGLLLLLPLVLTLPVTTSAICECYDELFS